VSTFECAMNRIEHPNFCAMTVVSYDELILRRAGGSSHSFRFFHSSSSFFSKAVEDIASGRCFELR
jgi:hypothetical protein